MDKMKDEMDDNVNFFVAIDNKKYLPILHERFPGKIITFQNSSQEILSQNEIDFIDMLLLSKNKVMIGSYLSTFTMMAWFYSGCKCNLFLSK